MEIISEDKIHGSQGRLSIGAGYQRFYCTHKCCFESLLWLTKFTEDPWDIWSELIAPLVGASTLSLCCAGHYRFPLHQYFYNLFITVYLICTASVHSLILSIITPHRPSTHEEQKSLATLQKSHNYLINSLTKTLR